LKTRDRAVAVGLYVEHDRLFEVTVKLARNRSCDATEMLGVREIGQKLGFLTLPDRRDHISAQELIQSVGQNLDIYSKLPKGDATSAALAQTVSATLSIDELFEEYKRLERDRLLKKTNREKNKFLAPKELAIREFKAFAGNIDMLKLKKNKVLEYKDKMITDVEKGEIAAGTANKKIMHLHKMFEVVKENLYPYQINPFSIKKLENEDRKKRPSFLEADIDNIDAALAQSKVNDELKAMMVIAKHTGCGPKELALLTSGDIFLNAPIPYIRIGSNEYRSKVKGGGARHREIPLPSEALEWMKKFPDGFPRYQKDNGGEAASAAANKFLIKHTGKTFYSFRHRIADLLRNTGCDQRILNSIFGHASKNRMEDYYGGDIAMKLKYDALEKASKEGPIILRKNQKGE
jgi:integrase